MIGLLAARNISNFLIGSNSSVFGIYQEDDGIRLGNGCFDLLLDLLLQRRRWLCLPATSVNHSQLPPLPGNKSKNAVPGSSLANQQLQLSACPPGVKQGGLAHVGSTHNGYNRPSHLPDTLDLTAAPLVMPFADEACFLPGRIPLTGDRLAARQKFPRPGGPAGDA